MVMSSQEREDLIKEIVGRLEEREKSNGNGVFKKIMIGVVVASIMSGLGGFIGVRTTIEVDQQRIKSNKENITRVEEKCDKEFKSINTRLDKIQEDQFDQWKYILEFANTRGENVKKN
jgi:hypothetical protein